MNEVCRMFFVLVMGVTFKDESSIRCFLRLLMINTVLAQQSF